MDSILHTPRSRGTVPNWSASILTVTIDPKSGSVIVGEMCIGSDLTENDFLSSDVGKLATLIRSTTDRKWHSIWLPDPSGREAGMTLGFIPSGKLQQIRLKIVRPETRRQGAWSATAENEIKVYHDQLLRELFGQPPYDFPWGCTTSVIDQHDYSAIIVVAYGRRDSTFMSGSVSGAG